MHGAPVEGMPIHCLVGDCTSRGCHCCHLPCLLDRFRNLSREERPEGSLLAFARSDVARAQLLSIPLQDGLRLLPPPVPAVPWARLTGCLPHGKNDGLTVFRFCASVGKVRPFRRQCV